MFLGERVLALRVEALQEDVHRRQARQAVIVAPPDDAAALEIAIAGAARAAGLVRNRKAKGSGRAAILLDPASPDVAMNLIRAAGRAPVDPATGELLAAPDLRAVLQHRDLVGQGIPKEAGSATERFPLGSNAPMHLERAGRRAPVDVAVIEAATPTSGDYLLIGCRQAEESVDVVELAIVAADGAMDGTGTADVPDNNHPALERADLYVTA